MAKVNLLLLIAAALLVISSQVEARQMAKNLSESKIVSKSIVNRGGKVKVSEAPEALEGSESAVGAEAPEKESTEKHHGGGRSVAGGGVIIGGLLTAILAAVFCYIRVTRRRNIGNENQ